MGRGAISCRHQRQGRANEAGSGALAGRGDGRVSASKESASENVWDGAQGSHRGDRPRMFLGTAEATVAIAKTAAGGACALSTALKKTARAALEDAVSARDSMMAAKAEVLATRRAIDALAQGEGGASAKCGDESCRGGKKGTRTAHRRQRHAG
ncbi:hypothetical protein ERJ75_000092900 [Trypanosoma vivax]|nr:hypothetical protein ERJ75_000092900 [Trypanosoma vivax]